MIDYSQYNVNGRIISANIEDSNLGVLKLILKIALNGKEKEYKISLERADLNMEEVLHALFYVLDVYSLKALEGQVIRYIEDKEQEYPILGHLIKDNFFDYNRIEDREYWRYIEDISWNKKTKILAAMYDSINI